MIKKFYHGMICKERDGTWSYKVWNDQEESVSGKAPTRDAAYQQLITLRDKGREYLLDGETFTRAIGRSE